MSHDILIRNPNLLEQVLQVAHPVAEFQRHEWSNFNRNAIEYKGAHDLVSYVDRTAEEMLVAGLSKLLPEAGFLTEEGTVEQSRRPLMWVVDPLDGTTNFAHGLPFFSISIALLLDGTPLLGMVWEPIRHERFTAVAGQGCPAAGPSPASGAARAKGLGREGEAVREAGAQSFNGRTGCTRSGRQCGRRRAQGLG